MNYKIRVENEAESKEAQELFEKLGFKKFVWGVYLDYFIFANSNYYSRDCISNFTECNYKEITLPQLRDLVVLKRNDVDDATHIANFKCDEPFFVSSNNEVYIWWGGSHWEKSGIKLKELKPIEPKNSILDTGRLEMKEFLDQDYQLRHVKQTGGDNHVPEGWIEIPEGAECLTECMCRGEISKLWWKGELKFSIGYDVDWFNVGRDVEDYLFDLPNAKILWKRHTKTEELPFVDDEPNQTTINAMNEADALFVDATPSKHDHYYIDVSDVDEIDFYEIALRYNVTDPCIQHILKKCLAVGSRGHKDFHTDLKDIHDTAKRALVIHGVV